MLNYEVDRSALAALVPLGLKVLRDGPMPSSRAIFGWCLLVVGLGILLFFLGEAG
jgi:hypothetical protein